MERYRDTVAIVGIGGIFPGSPDLESFWGHISAGRSMAREVPEGRWLLPVDKAFSPEVGAQDKVYSRRGCFLDPLPSAAGLDGLRIDPALLDDVDPLFHLLVHAGKRAFDDARTDGLDRARIGVIVGNLALPTETATRLTHATLGRALEERLFGSSRPLPPGSPLNCFPAGMPAGILAQALGLGGGCFTLDAACASSLYAIKLAADQLLAGRVDAMLTGGVSRPDPLFTQMGFSQLRALSKRGVCSPFDAAGDGLVVGEGAGIFLLKRTADAFAQGDHIYGIIRAVGLSNDVGGSLLAPMSEGQLRAMRRAYEKAGWSPSDVDLIECHATGTPVGDAVEVTSLKELWGSDTNGQSCVIGSVKSNIGHLLTAAGGAALTKVLLAMTKETLPPTANFNAPQPGMALEASQFRVLSGSEPWQRRSATTPRRAAVSAFGFGGINAHLLVEEWLPDQAAHFDSAQGAAMVGEQSQSIAVVGLSASFGPWTNRKVFCERVLGAVQAEQPAPPRHWWGMPQSHWFRQEGFGRLPVDGYYRDEVTVPSDRFRIPPREMEEMLPQQLLMLQTAAEALDDAGIDRSCNEQTGVFVGIALDLNSTNFSLRWDLASRTDELAAEKGLQLSTVEKEQWLRQLQDAAGPPLTANRTMGALGNIVASRVAREFRIGGPSFTISSEENSGLKALETAIRLLQNGELDRALVGAVDLSGDPRSVIARHRAAHGMPTDDSAGDVPPIGEGACAVVLKRLEDAERDGDRIYGVISGIGSSSSPEHAALAEQRAHDESGVSTAAIDLLEDGSGNLATPPSSSEEGDERSCALTSLAGSIGHSGATTGLVALVRTCLALHHEIIPDGGTTGTADTNREDLYIPAGPRYWLRNRTDGSRRAAVTTRSIDGSLCHVVLEGHEASSACDGDATLSPVDCGSDFLFALTGDSRDELTQKLEQLRINLSNNKGSFPEFCRNTWDNGYRKNSAGKLAMAMVARDDADLEALIRLGRERLETGTANDTIPALRDRHFYTEQPLAPEGAVAFVFPGSGNHFANMGRELFGRWPQILHRQDGENLHLRRQFQPEQFWNGPTAGNVSDNHRAVIFGQVAVGCGISDLVRGFGIAPTHAIGYSLGESAALFSQRAWRDRDGMYTRMQDSTLFTHDLAGECRAARTAWGLPDGELVRWSLGVADAPETEVRRLLPEHPRAYLLIVNTPDECVIGGDEGAVSGLVAALGCRFFPLQGVTTVHCEVAAQVAQPYHDLHLFPTEPPPGITYYSGVKGGAYELTRENAAESILGQALHGLNYPAVIESAYAAGARIFLEMGPGASCSRMIGRILGDRPHLARSACYGGQDPQTTLLRMLGSLIAERVPVDLAPLFKPDDTTAAASTAPSVRVAIGGKPFQPPRPSQTVQTKADTVPFDSPRQSSGQAAQGTTGGALGELSRTQPANTPHPSPLPAGEVITSPTDALLQQFAVAQQEQLKAHEAFLSFSNSLTETMAQAMVLEMQLRQALGDQVNLVDIPPHTSPLPPGGGGSGWGGSCQQQTSSYLHPPPTPLPSREGEPKPAFDRHMCMEFAVGSVARMLGPQFAEADSFPTRVRLPDEPLMLVDRIMSVEGEPRSMTHGRVITEHDVHPGAWYLDGGRIPTCIAVEAGQADLFLSGYLGIDFITRGLAVYRLLDAVVTFHRGLPGPGETIHYDIRIERFFRQGNTWLFRFFFEATVNGEPLMSMRDGCAGFFNQQELDAGKGIVRPVVDLRPTVGKRSADWQELVPMGIEGYNAAQLDRLREGNLADCFGPLFAGLPLQRPLTIPGGRMRLVHRVMEIDPAGGRCGMGIIRAEADIHPDDWFITCHFVDDRVMPGTLMYECCMHTLRVYLLRMGWVAEAADDAVWEPVPTVASKLCCRGQVLETTKVVTYEVTIRELGYRPEPYVICDALMYADGKPIVEITAMSARLTGTTKEKLQALWQGRTVIPYGPKPALYTKEQILAYSNGNPSEGFGDRYRPFDANMGRKIARLPGPPFQFMDRVTALRGEPWQMTAGAMAEAQFDLTPDAWFFAVERQPRMPFSVLLEAALQPCGWLAAYVGSALTSPTDISFRNLGGTAVQHRAITPKSGMLTCTATMKKVATSGGMIIQEFDFTVADRLGVLYEGDTMFGFFSKEALANQVGIRDAKAYLPTAEETARGRSLPYPSEIPFPDTQLRMIDRIDLFVADGGPKGMGYIRGIKEVDPAEWFFKAHFYEDPVTPGSLGLESFLQLVKFAVVERWGWQPGSILETVALERKHTWLYRGQIVPTNSTVTVEAWITAIDEETKTLTAAGFLSVDGKTIYQMQDFTVRMV